MISQAESLPEDSLKNMTDKQKEDGKAFETFNIKIDVTYLNPKYNALKTKGQCDDCQRATEGV